MAGSLLIFDGDCGFCTTTVDKLREALPRFPEAQPWQWTDLDAYGLTRDDASHYVWLVTPTHQYAGHLAVAALLRGQPGLGWRFLGVLGTVPPYSWAAAIGYKLVSRYRHLLPGGTPACAMKPTAG
ncbi:MAG: DUF393 domain-containing protein [Actinomycetales bacterium]|nr:DUF393 domain-containing protein [Actinomycetales bacterium]